MVSGGEEPVRAPAPRLDLESLPSAASRPLAIRLSPPGERAVRGGHPWVFAGSIESVSRPGEAGDTAVIFDRKGRFLAVGLFDPEGPIRIRILQQGEPAQVGSELFRDRIEQALARRRGLVEDTSTTGYRVLHGEGDGMPGLVLDRYGDAAVLKLYSSAWIPHLPAVVEGIREVLAPEVLLALASRQVAQARGCPAPLREGAVLQGDYAGEGLAFVEAGLRFEAHPLTGHKTGFYLDQRENRGRVRERTGGLRVLNVFSYTGGFSVAAAAGGGTEVTSVDLSAPALAQAERHFVLNPEAAEATVHRTVQGDAFEVLKRLGRDGARFGVVVVDPPSFAQKGSQTERALEAYGSLTRLALGILEPGGLLVQASCSSRVEEAAFFARLLEAAGAAGRPLTEVMRAGHPEDHPIGFPEGAYLKCLFARG